MNDPYDYRTGIESNPSITMYTGFKVMMFLGNVAHDVYDRAEGTRSHCLIPPLLYTLLLGFLKHLLGIWATMCMTSLDYFSPFSLKVGTAEELGAQTIILCWCPEATGWD